MSKLLSDERLEALARAVSAAFGDDEKDHCFVLVVTQANTTKAPIQFIANTPRHEQLILGFANELIMRMILNAKPLGSKPN